MKLSQFLVAIHTTASGFVVMPSTPRLRTSLWAEEECKSCKAGAVVTGATTFGGALTTAAATTCATGACAAGATATTGAVPAAMAAMFALLAVPGDDLGAMASRSIALDVAMANGKPSVVEFYSTQCPHCRESAKLLKDLPAKHSEVNWVMIDVQNEANRDLWESLGVDEIPHFAFLDTKHHLTATAIGPIDSIIAENGIQKLH